MKDGLSWKNYEKLDLFKRIIIYNWYISLNCLTKLDVSAAVAFCPKILRIQSGDVQQTKFPGYRLVVKHGNLERHQDFTGQWSNQMVDFPVSPSFHGFLTLFPVPWRILDLTFWAATLWNLYLNWYQTWVDFSWRSVLQMKPLVLLATTRDLWSHQTPKGVILHHPCAGWFRSQRVSRPVEHPPVCCNLRHSTCIQSTSWQSEQWTYGPQVLWIKKMNNQEWAFNAGVDQLGI